MKHINKYCESKKFEVDIQYLNYIFADFIDNGSKAFNYDHMWQITIDYPNIKTFCSCYNSDEFSEFIDEFSEKKRYN